MKRIVMATLLLFGACTTGQANSVGDDAAAGAQSIFLVRHAEKMTGENPSLTDAGKIRAEALAARLADAGITHIYSTNTKRTLETAAPISDRTGLEIALYDAEDLEAFADSLAATSGVHLVVGHSNTTPQLSAALGGDPGSEIDETSEYDRLYVITYTAGDVSSTIERFGVRYQKSEHADAN